jgi:hypothetical protein
MAKKNEWSQPAAPPPPLFTGQKEKDLVKQINDEVIETVVGQAVLYYSIDLEKTDYHKLYGEAIKKTFLPPIRVYAMVEWNDSTTTIADRFGVDRYSTLVVRFHRRRLVEDQDVYIRHGDFLCFDEKFYEITEIKQPKLLFGQGSSKFEIEVTCRKAREGLFDAN